ncbi:hypothetical protein [Streptomyces sp. H34-S4]|uniref:hypothetical protein n=1 Tax=Streptomyces sp. H34-S4 TaxID=2996463 RepID=UPI002270C929|nr:hypothetical protein [Streptomyces sp. H34-S4]MCY0933652.1 hypothetical protein [Streptomyces sp. H34-S4]
MELDRETLEKAAREALTQPSDSSFWDDRLFTTHGAVFHWAERGDDLLEESNYLTALDLIKAAADDGRTDTEISDEHVIDGTSRHWAVGSLRTIYVQVYEDVECEGHYDDDRILESGAGLGEAAYCDGSCITEREFTAAFVEATELALSLQDYPILDDSDYSEREWEQFEAAMKEAVEQAQRKYTLVDTCDQDDEIAQRFYEDESTTHRSQWCRAEDVRWATVAEEYKAARDAYFEFLAYEAYLWNVLGVHPDQLVLFNA